MDKCWALRSKAACKNEGGDATVADVFRVKDGEDTDDAKDAHYLSPPLKQNLGVLAWQGAACMADRADGEEQV